MQSCQLFRLLCLFSITFTCLGNGENNWCDCERLNDMLNAHTKHLSELVGYERKTDKLLEWKKNFSPSNNDVRNADTNGKFEGIENVLAVLKIRTEQIEEELAKYRNISQKLSTWIDESDVTIANTVRTHLQSATSNNASEFVEMTNKPQNSDKDERLPQRISLRRTPEQTIFEQMKLILANMTTELAVLRNYKVPRLESRVAVIEAELLANREP
uniref:Uncharacterized protein n=1 Tax=Daphnia galeata TaxID=27404 RepID=A0A8J2RAW9_9CRUS|nr:unnamed protein product [Daphnia galeata]